MESITKLKIDLLSILSLFTSFSTLICCALPALLVTLGLGAVLAGLVTSLPFLVTLSTYKEWTFGIAATLIGLNFFLVYRKSKEDGACEIPGDGHEASCDTASRWSKQILWISTIMLLVGLFMAYLALPLLKFIES